MMDDTEHTDQKHIIDSLYNSVCPRFSSRIPQRCSRIYGNPNAANQEVRLRSHRSEVATTPQSYNCDKNRYLTHSSAKTFHSRKSNDQQHHKNPKLLPFIKIPLNQKPLQKSTPCRKSNGMMEKPNNKFRVDFEPKKSGNKTSSANYGMDGDLTLTKNEINQQKHIVTQKYSMKKFIPLPDQATVTKHDDQELSSNVSSGSGTNVIKSDKKNYDDIDELQQYWEEKINKYDTMKKELQSKQVEIMAVYATLRDTHNKMANLGQDTSLPPPHELTVLNIGNVYSDQSPDKHNLNLMVDMAKLRKTKENIIAACDQTLSQRQEIIDWLQSLLCEDSKSITMKSIINKIDEFTVENKILNSTLQDINNEFSRDVDEIASILRKGINDAMNLQLKTEDLTYEISELNSQNIDLQKQIQSYAKRSGFKGKEALEKELKEEKCQKALIRERLMKAEAESKTAAERAEHLEEALNATQADAWYLKDAVTELRQQNQNLQSTFDSELNKLMESVQENSDNLKEISDARQKLQDEKEELEARIVDLTDQFNETIKQMQTELSNTLEKVSEAEKLKNDETEEKIKLQENVQILTEKLQESENLRQSISEQLKEMDAALCKALNTPPEIEESLNRELETVKMQVADFENQLQQKDELLKENEQASIESNKMIDKLKKEINEKETYINELKERLSLLEQQLQEGQIKMESYNEQLLTVKDQIKIFKNDLGDFENLNDLRLKILNQHDKLDSVLKENYIISEELTNQKIELLKYIDKYNEQTLILDSKNNFLKEFTEKELKQSETINRLRKELSQKNILENEINQKLLYKDGENKALIMNLEKRKQQIQQQHEIIHTLEHQSRQIMKEKQRDQQLIMELEKKISCYQNCISELTKTAEEPIEPVESIMRLFEDELGPTFNKTVIDSEPKTKQNQMDINKSYVEKHCFRSSIYSTNTDNYGTKKIRYLKAFKDQSAVDVDLKNNIREKNVKLYGVDKKYSPEIFENERQSPQFSHESIRQKIDLSTVALSQDPSRLRSEKQSKMLKLACHRI